MLTHCQSFQRILQYGKGIFTYRIIVCERQVRTVQRNFLQAVRYRRQCRRQIAADLQIVVCCGVVYRSVRHLRCFHVVKSCHCISATWEYPRYIQPCQLRNITI